MLDWFVRDRELTQIVTNHLRLRNGKIIAYTLVATPTLTSTCTKVLIHCRHQRNGAEQRGLIA